MEVNVFELMELVEDDILEATANRKKADKAFKKADQLLIKAGFKTKGGSALTNMLDAIWHQAEKEYTRLL